MPVPVLLRPLVPAMTEPIVLAPVTATPDPLSWMVPPCRSKPPEAKPSEPACTVPLTVTVSAVPPKATAVL